MLYSRTYQRGLSGSEGASGQANVQSTYYWSSTTNANNTNNAWVVNMNNGNVNNDNKNNNNYVWPVRAGEWPPPLFSFENLCASYRRCRKNKRGTINALKFEINAEENLFNLAEELASRTYRPSRSVCFAIDKPRMREIVAADFRDRVVHHLLVERLETIYEPIFIHDSYACRRGKGLHRGVKRIRDCIRKGSKNGRRRLYFVHLDIKNYFMTIDKNILFSLLQRKVRDEALLWLARTIIFHEPVKDCVIKGKRGLLKHLPAHKSLFHAQPDEGLPVGNLTSQFFANVYLNELDQFVKHNLKCRYYVRYCDDFLILSPSAEQLRRAKEEIREFLRTRLDLALNEKYERILPVAHGIDILGYIIRPDYLLVRRRVVNNMKTRLEQFKKRLISEQGRLRIVRYDYDLLESLRSVLASYFGHLKWANTYHLRLALLERYGFLKEFFSFDSGRIKPLYRFCEIFPRVRSQYLYYANLFKGLAVFFQVGRFYEFYSSSSPIRDILDLKPVKPNRRGAKYGFPLPLGERYAKIAAEAGVPVVIIRETDRYVGKIKERLPVMKIMAAAGD